MATIRDKKLIKAIAQTFKKLRKEKNKTLADVFFDTSIHIARIETNNREASISTINKLCKYYGLTLSQFFKDVEKNLKS
jgi:transcriptional regulator with XRE-family HTH domain